MINNTTGLAVHTENKFDEATIAQFFRMENVTNLQESFKSSGIAIIKQFLPERSLRYCLAHVNPLLSHGMRKDFLMHQTNDTPRHLIVIGGAVMNEVPGIMSLYSSKWLMKQIQTITGLDACLCDNKIENVIVTKLAEPGDTHGWHTDDFPIALVIALEIPPTDCGGQLELMRPNGLIEQITLQAGDAYIMRSDTISHRVAPLLKQNARTILNFTYSIKGLEVNPNGTAPLLCS